MIMKKKYIKKKIPRQIVLISVKPLTTPVIFIGFTELFERLKPNSDGKDEKLMQNVKKTKLLVIDDFGAGKITEWMADKLFELIDYRYCEELPIIFTTNVLPDKLKTVIGDRVTDRLKEMCEIVVVTSQSQRTSPTK